MESATTLVWSDGRVELDTESTVDADFALIIDPWNTEDDLTFWL